MMILILTATVPSFSYARGYETAALFSNIQIQNQGLGNSKFLGCENTVRSTLYTLPESHWSYVKSIVLHNDSSLRRGLAGKDIIYLKCIPDKFELSAVLIHELGHVVDLNLVSIDEFQMSKFQKISWTDSTSLKSGISEHDFASGYSQSNYFEDFAESYALYVLYGNEFRFMTNKSQLLQNKYDFIRYFIFAGEEFNQGGKLDILTTDNWTDKISLRFDVTRLHYKRN